VFTSTPLAACWRYEPREHRKPLAMLRDLRFRLPHCGTGSATPITIDFGAIFPFTLFRPTTSLSTLRSGRYRTPTQDSVRGCLLGFTAAAISGDRVQRTCTAQPAQIPACAANAPGSSLGSNVGGTRF